MSRLSVAMRLLFLLGFIVGVPLLALPSVTRQLDEALYGTDEAADESDLPRTGQREPSGGNQVAPATFEVPLAEESPPGGQPGVRRGLDTMADAVPELALLPDFPERPAAAGPPAAGHVPPAAAAEHEGGASIPERTAQIRQRLADLGADYILLEALEESGQHRFECRMLLAPGSRETETFEATGADAIAVAEQVLSAVEKWRSSQISQMR